MAHVQNKAAWIGAGILVFALLLGFSGGLGPRTALAAAPANDNFASAINPPSLTFSDTQNTTSATTEAGEPAPACQASFGHSVWYKFTAPTTDTYEVDTFSSDFDTVIDVYTGATLGTLASGACNDNTPGSGTGSQSQITGPTFAGTTYYIQVSGVGTAAGNLHVHGALAGQTITVNSTADTDARDSVLTLREAMEVANGTLAPGSLTAPECAQIGGAYGPPCTVAGGHIGASTTDTIVFAPAVFPTGAPATITLSSTLPAMSTGDDTVSGVGAGVIVDGVTTGFDCFAMTGAKPNGNTIKGLQITRCNNGVNITGANNAVGDVGVGGGLGEQDVINKGVNGILISGAGASGNFVRNNYIGTDVTGALGGFGNTTGVLIQSGAQKNIVGGTTAIGRNVISGNSTEGVRIVDAGTSLNVLSGNYIGTDATGSAALANGGTGVAITSGAHTNTVGGILTGLGNTIAFNGGDGVLVDGSGTTGNQIRGNSIHNNSSKGIENTNGGNLGLAPPVITAVNSASSVSGTTCNGCTVEVFSDSEDEGRVFQGVAVTSSTNWSFTGTLTGPHLTATATDGSGNTSQFSAGAPLASEAVAAGQPAPGGGSFDPGFDLGINSSGQAVFHDTVSGSSSGIYLFFAGQPVQSLALQGQPAPSTGGAFSTFGPPVNNNNGGTVARATLSGGTASEGLFLFFAGSPATKLAAQGDPAVGGVGGTFSSFGSPALNNTGQVAARATITGGSASEGLFLFFAGQPAAKLAAQGDPALGGTISGFSDPVINDQGQVASRVTISGGTASQGLFLFFAGSPASKLAAQGDPALGGTISSFGNPAITNSAFMTRDAPLLETTTPVTRSRSLRTTSVTRQPSSTRAPARRARSRRIASSTVRRSARPRSRNPR